MNKNQGRRTHSSELYDYRRAKLLLDMLAISDTREHLVTNLGVLCRNWNVQAYLVSDGKGTHRMDVTETLKRLSQFVLQHGKDEHQTRIRQLKDETGD